MALGGTRELHAPSPPSAAHALLLLYNLVYIFTVYPTLFTSLLLHATVNFIVIVINHLVAVYLAYSPY